MSRSKHNKYHQQPGKSFLKKYGNDRLRAKVKNFIRKLFRSPTKDPEAESIPLQKETGNPWDWD